MSLYNLYTYGNFLNELSNGGITVIAGFRYLFDRPDKN